jgi:uncharacterized Rmd1/YagE family protein
MAATKDHKLEARLPKDKPIAVHAILLGERLQLKGLAETAPSLGPLATAAGASGLALLFRYGVVVTVNLSELEQANFLKELHPRVQQPLRKKEIEETTVFLAPKQTEGVTPEGLALNDLSLPRLQIVATVLARSVSLAYYETTMANAFDLVEPLALGLERARGGTKRLKTLLRHIGGALLVQQKLIARVEIQDKPESLWEHPEFEKLYLRLEDEYELTERNIIIERKLALIARTAETALNLIQNRSMLRVEWYIVALIVFEVLLTLYQLWWKAS